MSRHTPGLARIATLAAAGPLLFCMPVRAELSVQFWEREYTDSDRNDLEDGINIEECENDMTLTFRYSYTGSLSEGDLYVYIGSGCEEKDNRDDGYCYPVVENKNLSTSGYVEIHPATVVEPTEDVPSCSESEGASDVFFLVLDDDSDETVLYAASVTIDYDIIAPDPPTDITSGYGENMIIVRWDVSDPDQPEDWDNFRIVCWEGEPVADVVELLSDDPSDATCDTDEDDATEADVVDDSDVDDQEICPEGGFEEGDEYDDFWACSGDLGSSSRSYDLTGLANGVPVAVSVVAIDSFGNESVIGAVTCSTPDEVDDFWEVYKKQGGGDDGGFCFVATAAWGDYDHPAVVWLREFRDEVLLQVPGGSSVVSAYYRLGAPASRWLDGRPTVQGLVRAALWPVAAGAWVTVQTRRHPGVALSLLLVLVMLVSIGVRHLLLASATGRPSRHRCQTPLSDTMS